MAADFETGANAARQFTIRSAPTSFGLSTSSGMPVRMPGSISTCGTDGQYWSSMIRTSCSTDGDRQTGRRRR